MLARFAFACVLALVPMPSVLRAQDITYWKEIRPLLRKHCTICHGEKYIKDLDRSGGLALDSYQALMKGSKQAVVVPGKSAESRLLQLLITTDEEKRMPRDGLPLEPERIDLVRRWIDGGAREGVETTAAAGGAASRRTRRRLDVILSTGITPPKDVLAKPGSGPLQLVLAAGPLPAVTAVCFSPDGKLLASAAFGQITIWDLEHGRPACILTAQLAAVNDLKFSPDGRVLAAAGGRPAQRGEIRLFHTQGWTDAGVLEGHGDVVFSVSFNPAHPRQLASASFDKTVRLWDLDRKETTRVFTDHSDFVYCVSFSSDGKLLASASKDRSVKVFDTATGRSRFTLSGMNEDVMAAAFGPDGKSLVSSGLEPGLYWWNAQTGERIRVQGGHGVAVHELALAPKGNLLASAGGDGTIRLWNAAGGAPIRTISTGGMNYAVALHPGGKTLASGGQDGLVRLWEAATGKPLATLLTLPGSADQWLVLTADGRVDGPDAVLDQARWRVASETFSATQARKALFQSQTLARMLRGEVLPPATFKE